MKKLRHVLLIWSVMIISPQLFAQESPLVVQPGISPDGSQIAFSYQGDIWTSKLDGSDARRLTIHEAYESSPVWSPDGKQIAFSSTRYGANDIFVMPATGGEPKRLTFYSGSDVISGWTDDNQVLFTSARAFRQIEWSSEILSVSATGGTPQRFLDATGYMPAMSPDGKLLAFVEGPCRTAREAYKGPANKDVWIYHIKNKSFTKVTSSMSNDFMPKWGKDNSLFFIGGETGRYNAYSLKINDDGSAAGSPTQVTSYTDFGIQWLDASTNGNTLVFERLGDIYQVSATGGSAQKINISISADYRFDPMERKTLSSGIDWYSISPNGKKATVVTRGEVFVKVNDKEKSRTVNLSKHAWRDDNANWLNDSTVIFTSDREGQYDLYLAKSADPEKPDLFKSLKHEVVRLTKTDESEMMPLVSPNGKKIAFRRAEGSRGKGKMIVADIDPEGKINNEIVLLDSWQSANDVSWSPDSKWLAYSIPDLDFNNEVYIHAADNSRKPVNVSMHPRNDRSPVWSSDGSKLAFISDRNNGDYDVWFAWLSIEDWEKTKQDWEEDEGDDEKGKKDKKDKKDGDEEEEETPITIDFEDIHYRLSQVTALPGSESGIAVSKDGETFYFSTSGPTAKGSDLYSINWDGTEAKQLTKGGQRPYGAELSPDGKHLYYVSKGRLSRITLSNGKSESLPFSAEMKIDHRKEREQVFEEAWKALDAGFYDPAFHGQDWDALKKQFKPLALKASTDQDFRYMFNLMLGQVNASHMGIYGGSPEETQRESTGRLGVEVIPVKNGVEVTHVVPKTAADKTTSKLEVGDVIVAVNGEGVSSDESFYSLLTNKASKKILLEVEDANGKSREVEIRPTSSIRNQLYDEWVNERKALTEKYSGGKLGYIHIQGMNWPSFERFERELTAAGLGKEGIVIDVRYNGGGYTTDYLMAVLNVRQHAYTIPRGAAGSLNENPKYKNNYPYGERLPLAAWTKPSIAICNESSYSNAEIFSHAFKTLEIGKLVGQPTFGAVISTGGQGLLDGSYVRMPFRAWYVKATGENMELGPAVPQFTVENAPDSKAKGEDEQLKKAVDELLKEVD
ncbi:S41 family peptidase [Flammeovirgaceae bacterium SG7u.111]|nr:S41 family peptidase [Flammeovirgaceae bacterium SG7u.132]WPO36432.1 S41 family peptidase [Flammeovirgaceae bacterium SG7u.111]